MQIIVKTSSQACFDLDASLSKPANGAKSVLRRMLVLGRGGAPPGRKYERASPPRRSQDWPVWITQAKRTSTTSH